ncbi:NADH-ubiquinone oxidoreductase [Nocardioides sp. Root1257]|nr:NADH-ubiquinone oxidoreductase [Nocardioides sp. Root1257]KRC43905.1 NADH-ubiquinone oxidoreductase [Nocardioides sp. Root224]
MSRVERSAWFTTRVTWALPDGGAVRWASRLARRRGRVELLDAEGSAVGFVDAAPPTARRLGRANLVAATAFTLGGALFAVGALMAQLDLGDLRDVDLVYLVGGVFFSLGGYVSVLQASNTPTDIDDTGALASARWRWAAFEPAHIGWLSAAVLFVGTLFFGVSLVAAFAQDLTPRQTNGWIWVPDMVGCVCFLVSGHLALVEVGHGRIWRVVNDLGWWIVGINQLGSILFLLAGIAAFTRPATSTALDVGLVNWGTFCGAVCFAVGGVLQLFERPQTAAGGSPG